MPPTPRQRMTLYIPVAMPLAKHKLNYRPKKITDSKAKC